MEENIEILKALGDKTRLLILEMLSCGELCACDIIAALNLTQPTISHHMKILQGCNIVTGRKEGKWMFYSINYEKIEKLHSFINILINPKENCICKNHISKDCI